MPLQTKCRLFTDLFMTILLLLLMPYSLVGETAHEWIGMAMFALFILHHWMNRHWLENLRKGKFTLSRRIRTITDLLILLSMIGSMISGILISQHIFSFLTFGREIRQMAQPVHMLCGFWGFVLMSFHIGLHIGMVSKMAKVPEIPLAKSAAALGALAGAYTFYQENMVSYLFLRTHFLMLNWTETLPSYLLKYILMMILFIWIGYYADKAAVQGSLNG